MRRFLPATGDSSVGSTGDEGGYKLVPRIILAPTANFRQCHAASHPFIPARSVEQPVNLDDGDDVFNYPGAERRRNGRLETDRTSQVAEDSRIPVRGGFLMCDDSGVNRVDGPFHRDMQRVFPDRPAIEIPAATRFSTASTIWASDTRSRRVGLCSSGTTVEGDGCPARWRGIYDDNGRFMVAMNFDSDLGDSWEWADDPGYAEKYSALGIRIGVNYVVYSMTR